MYKAFRFLEPVPNIYRVDYPYCLYLHEADPKVSMKNDRLSTELLLQLIRSII